MVHIYYMYIYVCLAAKVLYICIRVYIYMCRYICMYIHRAKNIYNYYNHISIYTHNISDQDMCVVLFIMHILYIIILKTNYIQI